MWWNHGKTHELDESHDGQTVRVDAGDMISIKLPHSSVDKWGFVWPYDPNQSSTVYFCGDGDVESGVQQLQFQAAAAGSESLQLERKQTPGNGNAVIKNFNITIEVGGSLDDGDDDLF
jgi:predicted secreted protein